MELLWKRAERISTRTVGRGLAIEKHRDAKEGRRARRGGDALMYGYEKQRNSLEPPRIGKVQLGDARAWNRAEEQSRGYELK